MICVTCVCTLLEQLDRMQTCLNNKLIQALTPTRNRKDLNDCSLPFSQRFMRQSNSGKFFSGITSSQLAPDPFAKSLFFIFLPIFDSSKLKEFEQKKIFPKNQVLKILSFSCFPHSFSNFLLSHCIWTYKIEGLRTSQLLIIIFFHINGLNVDVKIN